MFLFSMHEQTSYILECQLNSIYVYMQTQIYIKIQILQMKMQKQQGHIFVSHRQHYQNISNQQRSQYRKKLLGLVPKEGQPKIFKTQYQDKAIWLYNKHIKMNYYFAKQNKLKQPKAVFFSFHGLNTHGGTSGYLGTNIAASCSVDVYALDFKNFGLSEGPQRGFIPSFQEQLAEAEGFVDYIMEEYAACKQRPKIILSGLSFGGTISFKLAISKPLKYDYIVFFSPGLRQVPQAVPLLKALGKAVGYLFPTFKFMDPKFIDGNKYNMQQQILADEKNYTGKIIPGTIRTVLNAIQSISTQFGKLKTPYILFQSGSDKLVDVFAPLDLQKQCQSQDKMTIYCKDMWHSVYSEEQIEHIVPIVIEWINKRLEK